MERWDDLKLFLAVARLGTLTAAGRELHLNVSTLHRRLRDFERVGGAALFEKGPRGYRLTNAGEALLPKAEEVEEAIFSAISAVAGHDQEASGEVRITLPSSLLPALAPHLADFMAACPRIHLVVQAEDMRLDLKTDTDLALRATTQPLDTAIGRDLCGLAWARYAPVHTSSEDLPWIEYVGMEQSAAVKWWRKTYPTAKATILVQGVSTMNALLPKCQAQGLLPCFIGDEHPELRRVGVPVASDRLWLLVHVELRRSARVRALIDFLVPRLIADSVRFEGRVNETT